MSSKEPQSPSSDRADSAPVSEEILIARAKKGDFEAFESLVNTYQEKVYRLAFRFVRNETEAKEIVQDTLLSVWRKLDGFKGDSQFGSWLFRVTANAALMRLRSQRRHAEVSTEELPPGFLDSQQSTYGQMLSHGENWSKRPDEELQSEELRRQIQSAVDALPEIYRTVFLVRDVDGLSTEETAQALDLSIPTVKTRLHRARIALRDTIGAHFDGGPARGQH